MPANAYHIDKNGVIKEVTIPGKNEFEHWEAVRQLLGGDGVLVQPARQFEHTHGLIYLDEEGMWKHPVNATLTVALDVLARFYGPAVIMKSAMNPRFQDKLEIFMRKDNKYEFFKMEEE